VQHAETLNSRPPRRRRHKIILVTGEARAPRETMVKHVFFNITIGGEDQGRIIFELWDEVISV